MDLKVGYVVCLNFGVTGPSMTVSEVDPSSSYVKCMWFDDDDHLHTGTFHRDTLELEFDGEEKDEKDEAE